MFTDLKADKRLVKGDKYVLTQDRTDTLMGVKFTMPHSFTYKGVEGVGDHQDQHLFLDDGHRLVFCPALPSLGEWKDYLRADR